MGNGGGGGRGGGSPGVTMSAFIRKRETLWGLFSVLKHGYGSEAYV